LIDEVGFAKMKIKLDHYPNLQTGSLLPRDVWVWKPTGYEKDQDNHFPVIYMHDGQNLFFPERSYAKATWGVAEVITRLSCWGFIQPAIVVAIDNTENRFGDYLPTRLYETPEGQAYIENLKETTDIFTKNRFHADQYLELIVEKIKPMIDRIYRTSNNLEDNIIMGSSMGGLISLYALVEYPGIFGGAGCLSTHWPAVEAFILPYLRRNLPESGRHKIYFDHGTQDIDADYSHCQKLVDEILVDKGYFPGKDWVTHIAPSANHHEDAWRSRLHLPLRFLLGKH
jgi:predicted alpha/beta superfamily hydrolase